MIKTANGETKKEKNYENTDDVEWHTIRKDGDIPGGEKMSERMRSNNSIAESIVRATRTTIIIILCKNGVLGECIRRPGEKGGNVGRSGRGNQ